MGLEKHLRESSSYYGRHSMACRRWLFRLGRTLGCQFYLLNHCLLTLLQGQATIYVSHFIDISNATWKATEVENAFCSSDARAILQIPIGRGRYEDRVVWHHCPNGCYSVKSGYGLARSIILNNGLAGRIEGESSNRGGILFMWRCSHDI
uniref:Uncharacterized protein n=1 Tax=Davidia involucrata TaxID=16924 RepID=A0A5B6ZSV6_DAVIN